MIIISKPSSGLFKGTVGHKKYAELTHSAKDIISARTVGLDLREHPRAKSLTAKQRKVINEKISNRTATKKEYKKKESDRRFNKRRQEGISNFWDSEQSRILSGKQTTRKWNKEQTAAIVSGDRPKFNGKTIQGHHTFSASKYPHLANREEVIFPVTFDEHLYGWHGGNFKNSIPGIPIKQKTFYEFTEENN